MSVPAESVEVGRCYLTETGQVRRVLHMISRGRVQYERRVGTAGGTWAWARGMSDLKAFASLIEREVRCDWTPEADGPE